MVDKRETRSYLIDAAESLVAYGSLDKLVETLMDWVDMSTDVRVANSIWDEVASCLAERGCPYGSTEGVDQGQAVASPNEGLRRGI